MPETSTHKAGSFKITAPWVVGILMGILSFLSAWTLLNTHNTCVKVARLEEKVAAMERMLQRKVAASGGTVCLFEEGTNDDHGNRE